MRRSLAALLLLAPALAAAAPALESRIDVAEQALRRAKFRPAIGTSGQPVDYELRYEYEFRLND